MDFTLDEWSDFADSPAKEKAPRASKRTSASRSKRYKRLPNIWHLCYGWQTWITPNGDTKISSSLLPAVVEESKKHIHIIPQFNDGFYELFDSSPEGWAKGSNDLTIGFIDLKSHLDWKKMGRSGIVHALNFVSRDQESCYHSNLTRIDGQLNLEICYNVQEILTFNAPNALTADGSTDERGEPDGILLNQMPQPIYFAYNFGSRKSRYILGKSEYFHLGDTLPKISKLLQGWRGAVHPFMPNLVVMYEVISSKNDAMVGDLKRLLVVESSLLEGTLTRSKVCEQFGGFTQQLHELSRELIITEHYNDRDLSTVRNLITDMHRLEKESLKLGPDYAVDPESHERIKDGFLCLIDFCDDRARRLRNRKERVNNLITLLHNLTANHGSLANSKIAERSADIAHETQRDSKAMKTISVLAMTFLPAILVCSFLGTNLFALNTSNPSGPVLVVSDLWWVYLVAAIPLTVLTFGIWAWRIRSQRMCVRIVDSEKGD